MTVCKFFLEGRCKFGQACRFEHPRQVDSNVFHLNNQTRQQGGQQYFGGNQQSSRHFGQSGNQQVFGSQQRGFGQRDNQGELTLEKLLAVVKEDSTTWERSGQWLFSCYAPLLRRAARITYNRNSENLPGFEDYSPEELRWEAVMSNSSGNFSSYEQNLMQLSQKYKNLRKNLQTMDSSTADFIVRYERGEAVSSNGTSFASPSAMPVQSAPAQSASISQFSFKLPQSSSVSPASSAASSFRFQIPGQSTIPQGFNQTSPPAFGSSSDNFKQPSMSPFGSPASTFGQTLQSPVSQTQPTSFNQAFQNNVLYREQPNIFQSPSQPFTAINQTNQSTFGQINPTPGFQSPQATLFGNSSTAGSFTTPVKAFQSTTLGTPTQTPVEINSNESFPIDETALAEFRADKFTFGKIPRIPPPKELR